MNRYDWALGKRPSKKPIEEEIIERSKKKTSAKKRRPSGENAPSFTERGPVGFEVAADLQAMHGIQAEPENEPFESNPREFLINSFLSTAAGRMRLAASMTTPLHQRVNYESLARRVFRVDPLPGGATPIYDRLSDIVHLNEVGVAVRGPERGTRFIAPIYEISANPQIPLTQLRERRFDLIERAQDLAVAQIVAAENTGLIALLDEATKDSCVTVGSLAPNFMTEEFYRIELQNLRVTNVLMNAREYGVVRRWGIVDQEGQRAQISRGTLGTMWGAQINISRVVPIGSIYFIAEPQTVGIIPERTFMVLSADDPMTHTIGWNVFEQIGMFCHVNGVAKLQVTNG